MTYYTVYKTVNLLNGKFYFGVHKTENPNDEYLGSGTYIKRAVAKYGEQNFRKEVLFIYLDAESAFGKEDELIQCWRSDPLCMNLRKGGSGGFDYINQSIDMVARNTKVSQGRVERLKTDPEFKKMYCKRKSESHSKTIEWDTQTAKVMSDLGIKKWRGQSHSSETKAVMSSLAKGIGNSQFGTCWVFRGRENKKILRDDLMSWEIRGWTRGRKLGM